MRFVLATALLLLVCPVSKAADVPDDVHTEFQNAAKVNRREILTLRLEAEDIDSQIAHRAVKRGKDQEDFLRARSKLLHSEIADREKSVPPLSIWSPTATLDGRIGKLDGLIEIIGLSGDDHIFAVPYAVGETKFVEDSAHSLDVPKAKEDRDNVIFINGVYNRGLKEGMIINGIPGVFKVTRKAKKDPIQLDVYDADALKSYFDLLSKEKPGKQKRR
jgi:hypothetical protein